MEEKKYTDDIIELNRDLEPAVIQGVWGRSMFFKDKYKVLQFVHFSDVHQITTQWNRIVQYINHYEEFIKFAIHTGDYVNDRQERYTDLYSEGDKCKKTIFNCVGNHDTLQTDGDGLKFAPKEATHALLFNHTEDWDVNFLDIPHSMTYYKDFSEEGIRLIVLDLYYHIDEQIAWLKNILKDAKEKDLSVLTAMHWPTGALVDCPDTTFTSIVDYSSILPKQWDDCPFEDAIVEFKEYGGKHICNISGHHHHDFFGYTKRGILNIVVECATYWPHWCEGRRHGGSRTLDAFNVMSVDVNLGVIKLIRIGDNTDCYLRTKHTLCFDYINKKMIFTN